MSVEGVTGCFHELSPEVLGELPKADAVRFSHFSLSLFSLILSLFSLIFSLFSQVFALNSGLIFYPTWAATVDKLLVSH